MGTQLKFGVFIGTQVEFEAFIATHFGWDTVREKQQSLSLSLSNTHTHTHIHSLTHSLKRARAISQDEQEADLKRTYAFSPRILNKSRELERGSLNPPWPLNPKP